MQNALFYGKKKILPLPCYNKGYQILGQQFIPKIQNQGKNIFLLSKHFGALFRTEEKAATDNLSL